LDDDDNNKNRTELAEHISTWADYAHLQYASFWCIVFGGVSGRVISTDSYWKADCTLWLLAGLLLVSAFVSDWRLQGFIYKYRHPKP
jgi:hypothetical protein